MARIPIIKLNNGNTSYYPLSVGESTVTTHTIEVKNNIGGYQKGEIIPAVTTFDEILTNLFEIEGESEVVIDNITIVRNSNDELEVNKEEIFRDIDSDKVSASTGTMINSISQTNGKISVDTRIITKADIPTIDVDQVSGLTDRLRTLEQPLTKEKIPNIDISQVNELTSALSTPITLSRLPDIPISKVEGLEEALEVPSTRYWSEWHLDGESGPIDRIFWDESQWKYKNDEGILVTFDSGVPSKTDYQAVSLTIGDNIFVREKVVSKVTQIIEDIDKFNTRAKDSTVLNNISSDKSIIGRIKSVESGIATVKDNVEDIQGDITKINTALEKKIDSPITSDDLPSDIPTSKISGLDDALARATVKELTKWKNGTDTYENIVWTGTKWVWLNPDGTTEDFTGGTSTDYKSKSVIKGSVTYTRTEVDGTALSVNDLERRLASEDTTGWSTIYKKSIVGRIKYLEDHSSSGGGDITKTQVEDLDKQLHSVVSEEIATKVGELKFTAADSVEILTKEDLINVIKNILIKLGMKESSITIHNNAFQI